MQTKIEDRFDQVFQGIKDLNLVIFQMSIRFGHKSNGRIPIIDKIAI